MRDASTRHSVAPESNLAFATGGRQPAGSPRVSQGEELRVKVSGSRQVILFGLDKLTFTCQRKVLSEGQESSTVCFVAFLGE